MKKYKVTCEYYIKADSYKEVEVEVAEDCGIDFCESHIIIEEIK